jgi:hypothetical protein
MDVLRRTTFGESARHFHLNSYDCKVVDKQSVIHHFAILLLHRFVLKVVEKVSAVDNAALIHPTF